MGLAVLAQMVFVCLAMLSTFHGANAQFEDSRCHCICPPTTVVNGTNTDRKVYIGPGNIGAQDCKCEKLVFPQVAGVVPTDRLSEFCVMCECKFQSRNILMIQIAVILVISVISLLVLYMLFLVCLDPMLRRRSGSSPYQPHRDEDDNIFANVTSNAESDPNHPSVHSATAAGGGSLRTRGPADNFLNRMGQGQDKWMQKVREQRRNIFTDHTMLN
jgi:hypothetical protein